jgi:hypothetical protein
MYGAYRLNRVVYGVLTARSREGLNSTSWKPASS